MEADPDTVLSGNAGYTSQVMNQKNVIGLAPVPFGDLSHRGYPSHRAGTGPRAAAGLRDAQAARLILALCAKQKTMENERELDFYGGGEGGEGPLRAADMVPLVEREAAPGDLAELLL